jgi:hypothetical protein
VSGGEAPGAGESSVWGYVRLVPREGVSGTPSSGGYGSRALADVELVDYTQPGFAVVWAEGSPPAGGRVLLSVRRGAARVEIDPPHAALGVGGVLAVENRDTEEHVLSCPAAGVVRRLAPGAALEIELTARGEAGVFLLDVPSSQARVFASPGPFRVVSASGRYELAGLHPGPGRVHAWHPRFPPASASLDLAAGQRMRLDLELRVDRPEEESAHAR